MVKKEFSNVERRKNLTTAHGEQRDDNVVSMSYSFAWHLFWNTVFGERRHEFFFYSWLVSFSSFLFFYRQEKDVSNWHYQQFKMFERMTVSKNCKDAHFHWSFEQLQLVSLPYSLQLCTKFRCVCESNFRSIYWTTHQRDRRPLSFG